MAILRAYLGDDPNAEKPYKLIGQSCASADTIAEGYRWKPCAKLSRKTVYRGNAELVSWGLLTPVGWYRSDGKSTVRYLVWSGALDEVTRNAMAAYWQFLEWRRANQRKLRLVRDHEDPSLALADLIAEPSGEALNALIDAFLRVRDWWTPQALADRQQQEPSDEIAARQRVWEHETRAALQLLRAGELDAFELPAVRPVEGGGCPQKVVQPSLVEADLSRGQPVHIDPVKLSYKDHDPGSDPDLSLQQTPTATPRTHAREAVPAAPPGQTGTGAVVLNFPSGSHIATLLAERDALASKVRRYQQRFKLSGSVIRRFRCASSIESDLAGLRYVAQTVEFVIWDYTHGKNRGKKMVCARNLFASALLTDYLAQRREDEAREEQERIATSPSHGRARLGGFLTPPAPVEKSAPADETASKTTEETAVPSELPEWSALLADLPVDRDNGALWLHVCRFEQIAESAYRLVAPNGFVRVALEQNRDNRQSLMRLIREARPDWKIELAIAVES